MSICVICGSFDVQPFHLFERVDIDLHFCDGFEQNSAKVFEAFARHILLNMAKIMESKRQKTFTPKRTASLLSFVFIFALLLFPALFEADASKPFRLRCVNNIKVEKKMANRAIASVRKRRIGKSEKSKVGNITDHNSL